MRKKDKLHNVFVGTIFQEREENGFFYLLFH